MKRWTGLHYTEPGDDGMDPIIGESARSNSEIWAEQMVTGFNSQGAFSLGGMKSTRDLPPQSNHYDDEDSSHRNSNINAHPSPKASTVQVSTYSIILSSAFYFHSLRFSRFCNYFCR